MDSKLVRTVPDIPAMTLEMRYQVSSAALSLCIERGLLSKYTGMMAAVVGDCWRISDPSGRAVFETKVPLSAEFEPESLNDPRYLIGLECLGDAKLIFLVFSMDDFFVVHELISRRGGGDSDHAVLLAWDFKNLPTWEDVVRLRGRHIRLILPAHWQAEDDKLLGPWEVALGRLCRTVGTCTHFSIKGLSWPAEIEKPAFSHCLRHPDPLAWLKFFPVRVDDVSMPYEKVIDRYNADADYIDECLECVRAFDESDISEESGSPFHLAANGDPRGFRVSFWSRYLARSMPGVLYELVVKRFWLYEQSRKVWMNVEMDSLLPTVNRELIRASKLPAWRAFGIANIIKPALKRDILTEFKSPLVAAEENPFDSTNHALNRIVPFLNGTMRVGARDLEFTNRHSLHDRATRLIPYICNLKRKNVLPERFIEDVLRPGIPEENFDDDAEMIMRLFGCALVGFNYAQRMLVMTGESGSGKSTCVNILSQVLGRSQVHELKLKNLDESRFEGGNIAGKSMLTALDVPGNFLSTHVANALKGLVGGDAMSGEEKFGKTEYFLGKFMVIVTSNAPLNVFLDNDSDAWERRLAPVPWIKHDRKVVNTLADEIVKECSQSIVDWAMDAFSRFRKDGKIILCNAQQERVDAMLARSNPLAEILPEILVVCPRGEGGVTVEEILDRVGEVFKRRGEKVIPRKRAKAGLADAMMACFRRPLSSSIKRNGVNKDGYAQMKFIGEL